MVGRRMWCVVGVVAVVGLAPVVTAAGDLSFAVDVELNERYIFRGIEYHDGWSLQPNLALGWGITDATTLTLESWWNFAMEGEQLEKDAVYETDTTLWVSTEASELVELYAGYVNYTAPKSDYWERGVHHGQYNTDELFVGMTVGNDLVWFDTCISYDVDKYRGWYVDLQLGMTGQVNEAFSIEPMVHLGIASDLDADAERPDDDSYYLDDGFVDAGAALAFNYSFAEHFTAGASLNYALRFDRWSEATGLDDDYMWVGLKLGFSL
jgi:hypothetical protein